jgi:hypothetical protein
VIQSTPPRAEVIEQGRVLGVTPLEVKRKKGKGLQFVLRKRKHELATGAWKALQNESMSFRLEPHK